MKPTYRTKLKVTPGDIDAMGHVNNVVYVQWMQEVAAAHWISAAPDEDREKYRWVVLRHEIDYHKPALAGDEITAVTWIEAFKGVKSMRIVEIRRGEVILAKARTTWVMIHAESGRPARIAEEMARTFL